MKKIKAKEVSPSESYEKSLKTRIIQKNLVYLIGLPQKYANEKVTP